MKNNEKILIINCGGTFNKTYNQITGELDIDKNNNYIFDILSYSKIIDVEVDGIIYKDSLEFTKDDRIELVKYIQESKYSKIIIVHGTDTMDKTAKFLSKNIKDKQIVITGSMIPYSINQVEATSNMMMAYGFLKSNSKNNIYIAMHGNVKKFDKIKKNRKLGVFECL